MIERISTGDYGLVTIRGEQRLTSMLPLRKLNEMQYKVGDTFSGNQSSQCGIDALAESPLRISRLNPSCLKLNPLIDRQDLIAPVLIPIK